MTDDYKPSDQVIISHPDGRQYGVTHKAFKSLYKSEGFTVDGPEVPESFALVGVPKPRRQRSAPRPKTARKPKAAVKAAPVEPPAEVVE